ncbi:hypothetical protein G7Y79_00020g048940 [Physcia stellaris]|nr:hypothetical protein G7Y79_00020g048940 [Physcia stellaris]
MGPTTPAQLRAIMKEATRDPATAQEAKLDLVESTEEVETEIAEENENEGEKDEEEENEEQDSGSEHQLPTPKKEAHVPRKMLQKASEGAHAPSTLKNYKGQWKQFETFVKNNLSPDYLKCLKQPDERTPELIMTWIYAACDSPDMISTDTDNAEKGELSDLIPQDRTYSHALKMRSACSWHYGYRQKRGTDTFRHERDGSWSGNPSLSLNVSIYMKSLQRRKHRAGKIAISARAINERDLQRMWEYNRQHRPVDGLQRLGTDHNGDRFWAGAKQRAMLQLAYAMAFLCLLRIDEVLRIEFHHIEIVNEDPNHPCIKLMLEFRKTHQDGDIKPFYLYGNKDEPWLDVPHLLARWIVLSDLEPSGKVFRRFDAMDRVVTTNVLSMTPQTFLGNFRNNLADIDVDSDPFGTHSFRRGGVQYFLTQKRWDIRKLCDWGGWSMEYDNVTIVRYIINWNDKPTRMREDFLNPDGQKEQDVEGWLEQDVEGWLEQDVEGWLEQDVEGWLEQDVEGWLEQDVEGWL